LNLDADGDGGLWLQIQSAASIALAAATLLIWMIWMRNRPRTAMELPAQHQPASRTLRLVALFLDATPWMLLALTVTGSWSLVSQLQDQAGGPFVDPAEIDPAMLSRLVPANLLFLGMFLLYGVLTEATLGATLGKRLLKMRVVADAGETPDLVQIVLRNLTKLIELELATGVIWLLPLMAIWPMVTRLRQRLGDVLSRTVVASGRSREGLMMTSLHDPGPRDASAPHRAGPPPSDQAENADGDRAEEPDDPPGAGERNEEP
jgi:uncharacterized RDD family membrane protein YckC